MKPDTDRKSDPDPQPRTVAELARYLESSRPQLIRFIQQRLGAKLRRKMEPDDVFQELCSEAVRAWDRIDLHGREPFPWLCQLAERKIIDAHRRFFQAEKRDARKETPLSGASGDPERPGLIDLLAASITSPSAAFSRDQREIKLLAAMEHLPEENREAVRLRYIEGLPTKEIATRLGKSDGAVRVMLTRSLKKLEELMGPEAAPRPR